MSHKIAEPDLHDGQQNFIDTINQGPDALDHDLFDGPIDRVMLGLKAHANTICHARLIALEETFPMTRESIGDEMFNQLTRAFTELDNSKTRDNAQLGENFSAFMAQHDVDPSFADLAAIEWLWLESYNAKDAEAFTLEMLSELDEETLLSTQVKWHPSLRLLPLNGPIADSLAQLRDVVDNPSSMMIVRPNVEVNLLPIDAVTAKILQEAKKIVPLGNLLAIASEIGDKSNPLQPLLTLIGSGALICVGPQNLIKD